MLDEYKGIPREARLLVYLSFLPGLTVGFIYIDLSYFLTKVQGIPDLWMGLTITVMGLTLVVSSIPLGILADRYGRRNVLVLGNILAGASLIAFALTTFIPLLLSIAVLEGLGEAAFAVSFGALLADRAGDQKRTSAFSLWAFLGWTSGALGAFSISLVLFIQGFGLTDAQAHILLYIVVAVLGLAVTPLFFKIHDTSARKSATRNSILPRKSKGVLVRFLSYSVVIAFGAGLFVPIMTRWFSAAYGVSDALSGPVLGISSVLTSFAVLLAPRLAKKLGLVKAIVVSQASSTVFMVAVPSSPTFAIAGSIYTIRVFLMNLSNPLGQSLLMGLVSPDERGSASGITASLWRLPNALSVSLGAILIGEGLLALPFYFATVLYIFAITLFWLLFRRARLPEEGAAAPQEPAQSSSVEGPVETR
jgi:MFS family permease